MFTHVQLQISVLEHTTSVGSGHAGTFLLSSAGRCSVLLFQSEGYSSFLRPSYSSITAHPSPELPQMQCQYFFGRFFLCLLPPLSSFLKGYFRNAALPKTRGLERSCSAHRVFGQSFKYTAVHIFVPIYLTDENICYSSIRLASKMGSC